MEAWLRRWLWEMLLVLALFLALVAMLEWRARLQPAVVATPCPPCPCASPGDGQARR